MPLRSRITGTGSYAPEKVLTNFDLEKKVDTSDEWITERTGIKERRVASRDEAASDLCLRASRRAIDAAGIKPREIDMIIVATMSGDMPMPSTAAILQHRSLGGLRVHAVRRARQERERVPRARAEQVAPATPRRPAVGAAERCGGAGHERDAAGEAAHE